MPSHRLPWIVLLAALAVAAVLLFGPLWDPSSGQSPMDRPPGLNYAVAIQLGLTTLGVALVLLLTMAWASRQGSERSSVTSARRRRPRSHQH